MLPKDETLWDIQEAGQALLAEHGFAQYEISAYAQANKQATHNLNYWQFGDYLGIGAGAHGKLTDVSSPTSNLLASPIVRTWKTRAPNDYLTPEKSFLAGKQAIMQDDLALEFLMNALRLQQGFDLELFGQRTGFGLASIEAGLTTAIDKGLLIRQGHRIQTSPRGSLFLNEILALFM